ncbi:MAG: hypothetical protein JW841_11995 [Deltaproteobacteria bacterium]|nr:hypothetical protein [Deltaproteobacteria bacterium]
MRIVKIMLILSLGLIARGVIAAELMTEEPSTAPAKETTPTAEKKTWSVGADVTFAAMYLWRSIAVNEDPVIQPSATASMYGVTIGVWGNFDLTDFGGTKSEFSEVDLSASYSYDFGPASASAGAIYYFFPMGDAPSLDTTEIYAGITANTLLSPTLTLYQDIDDTEGLYIALSASHTLEKIWQPSATASMNVALSAGISAGSKKNNTAYLASDKASITDAYFTVKAPIAIGDYISVTPAVGVASLINSDAREVANKPDNFWGALSLSASY